MTAPPFDDVARLAALLRSELRCDDRVCFSCLVAGVRRVVAERDRQWLAHVEEAATIAESRIAALEADLRAAVAVLEALRTWPSWSTMKAARPRWAGALDAVLSCAAAAALREEDSHDD